MFPRVRNAGLVLALCSLAGTSPAMAHDTGRWHDNGSSGKPEWQVREEQRQREQAQGEREQEEQRQRNEQQQRRNEAWQLQQEEQQRRVAEEQRRRTEQQRRRDQAWQRKQESIQHRRAAAQNHQASHHHGNPHWNRGRRYDGPVNVVRDWDHYHLRQPARGQQWVRTDAGDYLLLEIANQLIVDMLLR